MRLKALLAVLLLNATLLNDAMAFDSTGIDWCDALLERYDQCLQSMTSERCELLAARTKMGRVYKQPGPAGAYYGARTYATPGERCVAEMQDLRAEMELNVRLFTILDMKQRVKACRAFRGSILKNTKAVCGRLST
jgi:hypothetical protein